MAKSERRAGQVTSVHITETCEKDAPHLITHVATTTAATTNGVLTETIHTDLQQAGLTPRQHLRGFWLYYRPHSRQQSATAWY